MELWITPALLMLFQFIPGPQQGLFAFDRIDTIVSQPHSGYGTMIAADAEPGWSDARMGPITMKVPYSPDWRISAIGLSVTDFNMPDSSICEIAFGRPMDAGTYICREYRLLKFSGNDVANSNEANVTVGLANATTDTTVRNVAVRVVYANTAKGRVLEARFLVHGAAFELYRSSNMGSGPPLFDHEVIAIIQGIIE